jgi:RNA polymerase sigma factor (sigma-70 family)
MGVTSTQPLPSDTCDGYDGMMAAIEAVYAERFARFHRVACGILGDTELGRDAVQEAFARAIRRRGDYRGDGPLEGWLWRTVINVARDHCRANKGLVPFAECPEPADDARPAPSAPVDDVVRTIVASLPERQRLVLYLRYYVDMSYTDIGQALDIRTGTVSATLSAAHGTLRDALENSVPGEAGATSGAHADTATRPVRERPRRATASSTPGALHRGARPSPRRAAAAD